jgi:hypothetical protein
MKNIKLEDDKDIRLIWAEIFLNVNSCSEFESLEHSVYWSHCPLCFQDREEDGLIQHKPIELLFN